MPWLALIPIVTGAAQAISGGIQKRKSEGALENMKNPSYSQNQSILDYYDKALAKYNTNPTDTREYKQQKQDIQQGVAQGLNQLQNRRSGLAGISNLIQGQNNALLKAAVAGEQRKAQEFATLGNATNMKANEGQKDFQYNKLAPFEKDYNLLAMKAGAASQRLNSGIQNIYQGANAYGSLLGGGSGGKAASGYGGGGFGYGGNGLYDYINRLP